MGISVFQGIGIGLLTLSIGLITLLLAAAQVFNAFMAKKGLDDVGMAGRYRIAATLAVVTPLFLLLASVVSDLGEELSFIRGASLVTAAPDEQIVFLSRAVREFVVAKVWLAVALTLSGAVGVAGTGSIWLRHRKRGSISTIPFLVVLGVGLMTMALGTTWAVRDFLMSDALQTVGMAGAAEKLVIYHAALRELPSMSLGLVAALVGLAVTSGAALVVARRRKQPARTGWRAAPAGILILVFGLVAVLVTRGHARDTNERLPALMGKFFYPATSQCNPGDMLFFPQEVSLPTTDNAPPFERTPVIVIDKNGASIGGQLIASAYELRRDEAERGSALKEVLLDIRRRFQRAYPGKPFPGRIALGADIHTGGAVLAKVLTICRATGYDHAALVFSKIKRFDSSAFGTLMRFKQVGIPVALVSPDMESAMGADETLGQWLARSKFRFRTPPDARVLIREPTQVDPDGGSE